MALRNISNTIKTALSNNDPLQVYHLVKFEKPSQLDHEAESASDYVYLTDAPYPVTYDSQTYHPGGLLKVGKVPESTEAKATNLTLILSATKLGKQSGVMSVSCSSIAKDAEGVLTVDLDLFKSGFYPGDIVTFSPSVGNASFKARIDSLYDNGTKIKITNVGTTTIAAKTNVNHRVKFDSSEVDALVAGGIDNSGATTTFSPISFDNYINRSVTIYRVFSNPSDGVQIGNPVILFKGIIAKGTLNEKPQGGSTISWSLTSHWGDFVRVAGRITSDEFHRGLDSSGISNEDSAIRPEYVQDYGFQHADSSLNVIASYTDIGTKYKMVKRGGLAGLLGGKKVKEEKFELTKELDLSLNLDARHIPLVYGVQKVDPIPVFADVQVIPDSNSNDNVASGSTNLFQAQVLCEGPIGGIYDIYMEDKGLICRDEADSDVRTGSDNDIPCIGRMDRGNVLGGSSLYSSSLLTNSQYGSQDPMSAGDFWQDPNVTYTAPRLYGPNSGFQNRRVSSDGILHRQSFKFPEAKNIQLTVHTGKEDQKADQTLLSLAANADFLVQKNYYRDDISTYWTEQHKLLDTAYVVTKDVINAEDGRAPDLSFVVRGKFVDCHNYDGSYKISSGDSTNFNLGDSVTITLADNSNGGTATIIDRWSFLNIQGISETRLRFSFDVASTYNSIVRDGTAGKFTATKSGVGSLVFISPEYSNNENFPVTPTTPVAFAGFYVFGASFDSLSVPLSREVSTVTYTEYYENDRGGDAEQTVTRTHYKYTLDFSGLSTTLKDTLKIISETNGTIDLTATGNSQTKTVRLELDSLNTTTMIYTIVGQTIEVDALLGGSTTSTGTTSVTLTAGSIRNYTLVLQNSADSTDSTEVEGLNIEVTKEDLLNENFSVLLPSTGSLRTFCNTNNILVLSKNLPSRFRTTSGTGVDANYLYGIQGSHLDTGLYTDARVTTNPAMQLLDYLTSKRYGKGLDITKDLDLESFKQVARNCDTGSDVNLLIEASNSDFDSSSIGDKYKYPPSGNVQWQGTVKSVTNISKDGSNYKQVLFEDCIGKFGHKWYSYQSYENDHVVWTARGHWVKVGALGLSAGIISKPTSASTEIVYIRKVGGTQTTDEHVNTSLFTNLGNPFVKQIDSNDNVVTGYTLYDSDDVKYWKYLGWDAPDQRYVTRHQTNATIDTSNSVFDNVNSMLRQFNGILRYANGKYFLDQKVKAKSVSLFGTDETITEDDIVGNIKISDKGISKTFNSVNAQIIDPANNFEPRSIAFYNSIYKKQDKGIPRQGSYDAPGISNYFNARLNIKQVLDESRAGLEVSFTMAPRGYLLLAGNVIAITYEKFNWTKKLFRIENLNTRDDLLVDIVAKEHNDSAYLIDAAPSDLVAQYNTPTPGAQPPIVPDPIVASSVTATADGFGGIRLSWTNSANYSDASHLVEVYRNTTQSYTGGSGAQLVGLARGNVFTDSITDDGQSVFYYWLRYSIDTVNNRQQRVIVTSPFEPRANANGVEGTSVDSQGPTGPTGPIGPTGSEGVDAAVVKLTSPDYSIVYTEGTPSPTGTLTLTATAQHVNTPWFKFTGDGIADDSSFSATATKTYTIPTTPFVNHTIRVGVANGDQNELAFDTISIIGIESGEDGITVVNTNSAHTVPTDNSGTVLTNGFVGSGTTLEVYKGGTQLTNVSGTPGQGQFSVSLSTSSVTADSSPTIGGGSASKSFVLGPITALTANTGFIKFDINIENTTVVESYQTFSKSIQGVEGPSGPSGPSGPIGPSGATGLTRLDGQHGYAK